MSNVPMTDKANDIVGKAINLAADAHHPAVHPLHLLRALLEDEDSFLSNCVIYHEVSISI